MGSVLQATRIASLDALFRPRSVAIVGASNTASKIGGVPLDYCIRYAFSGVVYPVNPAGDTIQGLPAYRSLSAIGKPVDLVIVAVPAALVPSVIDDAIAAGVKAMVLFSSGFAEIDEAGRLAQEAMKLKVQAAGIRLLGPNCLGMMSTAAHLYATFSPSLANSEPRPGPLAIVSQSGAFGAYALQLAMRRGIGISYWATTGNEGDVELADCVAWLAGDANTRVILCYMEGSRDGAKLRAALELARANGKRVVMIKVGRTESGQAAVASHTASLAGQDAVYDALLRQCGVFRAQSIDEFFAVGYAASMSNLPAGKRLAILTVSGGVGALMADDATSLGLTLPEMSEEDQAALRKRVPFCGPRNPVDITGQFQNDNGLLDDAIRRVGESGRYDAIAVFTAASGVSTVTRPIVVNAMLAARKQFPLLPLVVISLMPDEATQRLEAAGCLVFSDPTMAMRALAALTTFAPPLAAPKPVALAGPAVQKIPSHSLTEYEALEVLRKASIAAVPATLVTSADQAANAAREAGFPVVLKVVSRDILHKTEAGGVRLNLHTEEAVRAAFAEVQSNARHHQPDANIEGALVMPMVKGGVEMILGIISDPVFGPVVLCGLGGIFAEALRDTVVRVAPIQEAEALEMVNALRGRRMLDGMRGQPASDIAALVKAIVALSQFAIDHAGQIDSLDINPFVVLPAGKGACALDALIVPSALA